MNCDNEELEATKNMTEKTADEMFEELGYNKLSKDLADEYEVIFRSKDNVIVLLKNRKIRCFDYMLGYGIDISMQELQAINKKVEELGWI